MPAALRCIYRGERRLSLWHACRWKRASERKHHPIADVAAAGGWKDRATLLECSQQPDEEALLAVVAGPRKRDERLAPDLGAAVRLAR
jgi:hypothetical protein